MHSAFAPRPNTLDRGPSVPRRTPGRAFRDIVVCSMLVTLAAALVAAAAPLAFDVRWSFGFVIARWIFVAALLTTPLLHQLAVRFGVGRRMPWVLRTPATALLLTVESIAFDILSARLGG